MKIFKRKNKIMYFSFGALDGVFYSCQRKIPNYQEFETKATVQIGKVYTKNNPLYDGETTTFIFFCFRFMILKKEK